MRLKTKIFMGGYNVTADEHFNSWINEKYRNSIEIDIKEFRYQQARCGDHSICILYEEVQV